jgi:hypothetical protein
MHELFLLTTSTRAYVGLVADIAPRWRLDTGKAFSVPCLASIGWTLQNGSIDLRREASGSRPEDIF